MIGRRSLLAAAMATMFAPVGRAALIMTSARGTAPVGGAPGELPSFTLTSSSTGTHAFTIGHAFKQGDVPSGLYVTSDLANFQCEVRNRWQDGSVKFAALSGRAALTADTPFSVQLGTTSSAPGGSNIAESALISLAPSVSMALSGFGTVTLSDLLGSPVRSILGPQMSEFHYRSAVGADAHLAVWFFCRLYANNDLEIETCVENGYMKVASPADKSYTATLTIDGTERYSASLNHRQRTRWMTINWYDGSSGLTDFTRVIPAHDAEYLRATKLVPNYSSTATPSDTYLNAVAQAIVPMGNASLAAGSLAGAGASDHIGILPRWDAAYCISADPRAFKSVVANVYGANSWPVCYRDESTQRPLALTNRPNLDAAGWGIDPVVAGTTSNPNSFGSGTQAHMPAPGFLGYLVTGRWTHLETAAFWAARSHMEANPTSRGLVSNNGGGASWMTAEDRGRSWHLRSMGQVACAYPDTCPTAGDQDVRDDWLAALSGTTQKVQDDELDCPLGYMSNCYNPGAYSPTEVELPDLAVPTFMGYFNTQCWGYVSDLALLSGDALTRFNACRDHFYKLPIGMLGDSSGFCYRTGPQFLCTMGTLDPAHTGDPSFVVWNDTWAECYDQMVSVGRITDDPTCAAGGTITSGNFPDATSYGANMAPAIAYAVDHGALGADAAYAAFTGASNYATFDADRVNAQQWAVVPR